jgi:parvulin-like peptidyl-prolyl isomerase
MPMMAKMRSLAPWFIITVGGLFVLFMVVSDSRVLEFMGQQSQYVGSINGVEITYQEYSNLVERFRQNQEQSTGQTIDESQMDFFRDQVWDLLVNQKLTEEKISEFGIIVSDDEIRNSLLGPNPPQMLIQQFTDSAGNFNRQLYEQALRDPRNKELVIAVEDQIRQQLTQEKLQNYITASITVSEEEAYDKFIQQNIKMRTDYIQIDPNSIQDGDVKITDADLKKYYDNNLDKYKIESSRKLKYVLFRRIPSQGDTLSIIKNLEAIVAKLKSDTATFKTYVEIYSEQPYSKDTVSITSIPAEARSLFNNAKSGEILGPVLSYEGCVAYRFIETVKSKNEYVRASHILVRSTGNDAEDLKKANDIYNEVTKGADFSAIAASKSDDRPSAANGGDLDWFGKGQMVPEFEKASFSGKVGVIQKPIKTNYGYHIIKVTGKSNKDFVIEKIVNKIQMSATTSDKLFQSASDFAYVANENEFETEAKLLNYDVIETPPFTETAQAIPGMGVNTALVKWAFENSIGDISEVYRVPAGYVVSTISEVIKPGFKKLEDVKNEVRSELLREKKFEKAVSIAKEIRSKVGDNGDKSIAKSIWTAARVDSTSEFTTVGNIPGIGKEFAFSEYAIKGELNKWSQPIRGNIGVYLINVRYKTKFDSATYEFQRSAIKKELITQKKSRYYNQWIQDLKKEADIVDNRYLFYR